MSLFFYISTSLPFFVFRLLSFETDLLIIVSTIIVITRLVSLVLFYIFIVKALLDYNQFEKQIGKKPDVWIWILLLLLGPVIYIVFHFYYNKKMKEQLHMLS